MGVAIGAAVAVLAGLGAGIGIGIAGNGVNRPSARSGKSNKNISSSRLCACRGNRSLRTCCKHSYYFLC